MEHDHFSFVMIIKRQLRTLGIKVLEQRQASITPGRYLVGSCFLTCFRITVRSEKEHWKICSLSTLRNIPQCSFGKLLPNLASVSPVFFFDESDQLLISGRISITWQAASRCRPIGLQITDRSLPKLCQEHLDVTFQTSAPFCFQLLDKLPLFFFPSCLPPM